MNINPVTSKIANEISRIKGSRRRTKSPVESNVSSKDSSLISETAKRLSTVNNNNSIALSQVKEEPEIRQERVEKVKERIDNGYYNKPEVMDKIADSVISDLHLSD